MKKLLLFLGLLFTPSIVFGQSQGTLINDFRKMVGEPDSAGGITRAIAHQWLGMGLRKFADYGVLLRETTYVGAANIDTFRLPVDYKFPYKVKKTVAGRAQKFTLAPIQPESANYFLRNVGLPFLFERTDTIVQSVSIPNVALPVDVYEVRGAYRKDLTTGGIKQIIRISSDSLGKIATTPSDYFYFVGQPFPRMVFGKKATFGDTVFAEVLAIIPRYISYDTGAVSTTAKGFLEIIPPLIRADTLKLTYAAELDTTSSDSTSALIIQSLSLSIREALKDFMAAQYYFKREKLPQYEKSEADWRELLTRYAIQKGIPIALPAK